MEYIIRELAEKDLTELVQLCCNHADFEQEIYNSRGKEALLKNAIFSDKPKLFCYIIENENKLQGYFSYTFDYSTWDAQIFLYLDCLYLEPAFRGLKIGETVFDKLIEIEKKNDCINIQWQTPIFNDRAIKFYNRIAGTGKDKKRFFIEIQQAE